MPVQCTCVQCGASFVRSPSEVGPYCSPECYRLAHPKPSRPCEGCGIVFQVTVTEIKRGHGRFHSLSCFYASQRAVPLSERFWPKVNKDGPLPAHCPEYGSCWMWTAGQDAYGYGFLAIGRSPRKAHQVAWEESSGPVIPPDMDICHTCDNRACVRNDVVGTYTVGGVLYERRGHLWIGDNAANQRDRRLKRR
jgi:hypothetical protein